MPKRTRARSKETHTGGRERGRDAAGKTLLGLATGALILMLAAGCAPTATSQVAIEDLTSAPEDWENDIVRVRGQVVDRPSALPPGAYLIQDGTGTLMVVSEWAGAPPVGTTVELEGRYRSYVSWDRLEATRLTQE